MGQPFPWLGLRRSVPMQSAPEVGFSHGLLAPGEKGAQDLCKNTR